MNFKDLSEDDQVISEQKEMLSVSGNSMEIKRRNSGQQETLNLNTKESKNYDVKSVVRRVYTPIHIKLNDNYLTQSQIVQHSFMQRPSLSRKLQSLKSANSIREVLKISSITFPR